MKISALKKIIKREEVAAPKAAAKKTAPKKVAVKKAVPKVAKKVAVKSVAKKAAPKKAAGTKKTPAMQLVVASDSESFWVTSGQVLNSLIALEAAFASMPQTVYSYHTSSTGSDFADWVEAVLRAPDCASLLRKAKTAKAAQTVVTKYLKAHNI